MSLQKQMGNRLRKELAALQKSPLHGIRVYLPSDDFYIWEAEINGPEQSYYAGGKFKIRISLPEEYPMEPPVVQFLTSIYHVNVSQATGQVCLSFLSRDAWVATGTIEQLLHAIYSLLIKPEIENSFDHDVLNKYQHFRRDYETLAKRSAATTK
ncbi:uncharacterized protein LOC144440003 [Glandiceps talaboti]